MQQADSPIGERLRWLPDETLFSWCSRYHVLSCNGIADATCLQLFGRRRHGAAHDFPAGLEMLVARSQSSLGTVQTLARDRTLLPFYGPFRSADLYDKAVVGMRGDGIGSLKFQLGLLTSGLGAAHPLKACPTCMDRDRRQHAVAYWRRTHQWPAVWVCPIHGDPLLISPVKLDQRARFEFSLPADAAMVPWWSGGDSGALKLLQVIAGFAVDLCSLAPGRLADATAIAHAMLEGMRCRGWGASGRRIAWRRLDGALQVHAAVVGRLPPFAMQLNARAAQAQLARVVAARSLTQPLRYLVWLSLVFDDLRTFIEHYDRWTATQVPTASSLPSPARSPARRERGGLSPEAASHLRSGKESATALAKRYGVDPSTVAAWAAKAGFETPRRPKVLDEKKRSRAIERLLAGYDKAGVAARLGVSDSSVTKLLRQVPGLQEHWHEARRLRARENARAAWMAVASAAPLLGVAAARRGEPAAYAWLYRNDREWLRLHSSGFANVRQDVNHASARMERADERYARALRAAVVARAASSASDLLDPEHWAMLAPGLRRVLRRPQAWPRTMLVLKSVLGAKRRSEPLPLF